MRQEAAVGATGRMRQERILAGRNGSRAVIGAKRSRGVADDRLVVPFEAEAGPHRRRGLARDRLKPINRTSLEPLTLYPFFSLAR